MCPPACYGSIKESDKSVRFLYICNAGRMLLSVSMTLPLLVASLNIASLLLKHSRY